MTDPPPGAGAPQGRRAAITAPVSDDALAEAIVRATGVRAGLCVHLGVTDGALDAALWHRLLATGGTPGAFLVHGLAADEESAVKARQHIQSQGLYGRVSVERGTFDHLPYADNLVNLLVADDAVALLERGLSLREVLRVLAPNGVACVGQRQGLTAAGLRARLETAGWKDFEVVEGAGVWAKVTKPRPAEMDEWTHKAYDASGNCVSRDGAVGPLSGLRWLAGPTWPLGTGYQVSNGGMVSAAGRTFYVTLNETSNLSLVPQERDQSWFIVARDAYNGLLLWRRPIGRRMVRDGQEFAQALVAAGERVFTVIGDRVVALSALTGETVLTYPGQAPEGATLLCHDGALLVAQKGLIRAYEAADGRLRWEREAAVVNPLAGEGQVFYCDPRHAEVTALDLATGQPRWRADVSAIQGGKRQLLFCQGSVLIFVCERNWQTGHNGLAALSTRDGRRLWDFEYTSSRATWPDGVWYAGGLVWHRRGEAALDGLDPLTGTVKRSIVLAGGYSGGCCRNIATEEYLIGTRPLNFFNWQDGRIEGFRAGRHACRAGVIVANGLLYSGPHGCKCVRESLRGFLAFAPAESGAQGGNSGTASPALEVGPGEGVVGGERASEDAHSSATPVAGSDDWPTFRHDAKRTGATTASVPSDVAVRWRVRVCDGVDSSSTLAAEWRAGPSGGDPLTAPVVAGGMVFVGLAEAHGVAALDAASGEQRWTFTAGGRVDTPPTIHEGLCLFGSADGWMYCLRASDGTLVWRLRAAPAERRIVAFGQVESPWPVVGGVLVEEGLAYAVAGRSAALDGGLVGCAIEPRTGKVVWTRPLEAALSDLLVSDGSTLRLAGGASGGITFDLKTGRRLRAISSGFDWHFAGRINTLWSGSNRVLDRSWRVLSVNETASFWMRVKQGYGPHEGQVVIADPQRQRYYGFRFPSVHWSKAKDPVTEFGGHLVAWEGQKEAWTVEVPATFQPESLVAAGDLLFAAGPADRFRRQLGAHLWALSAADGTVLSRLDLPAAPVAEGLAAVTGCLYASMSDGTVVCLGND